MIKKNRFFDVQGMYKNHKNFVYEVSRVLFRLCCGVVKDKA
jgi:hypothetical protein